MNKWNIYAQNFQKEINKIQSFRNNWQSKVANFKWQYTILTLLLISINLSFMKGHFQCAWNICMINLRNCITSNTLVDSNCHYFWKGRVWAHNKAWSSGNRNLLSLWVELNLIKTMLMGFDITMVLKERERIILAKIVLLTFKYQKTVYKLELTWCS